MLLQPQELNVMAADFRQLIDGPDGNDVVLHWMDVSGTKDTFGRSPSETERTEQLRAHVSPVTNHNVSVRAVQKQLAADVQTGDVVFLFHADVDLNRESLWIEVAGLGNFTPEAKPPTAAQRHATLFPSGQSFVQEIYTRVKR